MRQRRVLVVGTTPDYIEMIRNRYPGRAVFLTDLRLREKAAEPAPEPGEEIVCDLTRTSRTMVLLDEHLKAFGVILTGVACYDCESLYLASIIARSQGLPFPTSRAVLASRNKVQSKILWEEAGVPCPSAGTARDVRQVQSVLSRIRFPVVLKPLTGSGSELVFKCSDREEVLRVFGIIQERLAFHTDVRMYSSEENMATGLDPRKDVVIEEFVEGQEYSCDFLYEDGRVRIIRTSEKIFARDLPLGTVQAYLLPAGGELKVNEIRLSETLRRAAASLSFYRSMFMVDFIPRLGKARILELTPRPSGDCLPWLIAASSGMDIIGTALDVAEGRSVSIPEPGSWKRMVGLRLFARESGEVRKIDTTRLEKDPRVKEVHILRRPGHRIVMPPDNYGSMVLGHVIFEPGPYREIGRECDELTALVDVDVEPSHP